MGQFCSFTGQRVKFNSSSFWFAAVTPSLMFLNRPKLQLQMAVLYMNGKVPCHDWKCWHSDSGYQHNSDNHVSSFLLQSGEQPLWVRGYQEGSHPGFCLHFLAYLPHFKDQNTASSVSRDDVLSLYCKGSRLMSPYCKSFIPPQGFS